MVPLADLFVQVYVWSDDALKDGTVMIPKRPSPPPAWSDAEVRTIALVRHRWRPHDAESAFLDEVRREWAQYFPRLPHQREFNRRVGWLFDLQGNGVAPALRQREFNRRVGWLWGAFEPLRQHLAAPVAADPWQQITTTALPVKHPSRVRGPDQWHGPGAVRAGFGKDAAHHEWCSGFRLAVRTDLGRRLVRAWGIVPAAVDERAVADALLDSVSPASAGLLLDRGFVGRTWAAGYAERGIRVVLAHSRADRRRLPKAVRQPVAKLRNRIETSIGEITDGLALAGHGAKTFWGLLARTASTLLAHTIGRIGLFQST